MLAISMRREAFTGSMAHIFMCSSLIILQNLKTYELNICSAIDIALQLCLMMKTWKQFLRYWAEMAQNMYIPLLITITAVKTMLESIYSATNVIVTQICRAMQQYHNWLWQHHRPIVAMETDYQQGGIVCISNTIQRYYVARLDTQDPHTDCARLDQGIARNKLAAQVEPLTPTHALAGPDGDEPPPKPTPLDRHQHQLRDDWATPIPGALLNLEYPPQQEVQ